MNARGEFRRSDWVAVAGGLIVGALILLTGLIGRQSIEAERRGEITSATEQLIASVVETVASDIGRALGYGIPINDLYGVEPYLAAVVAANSEVAGIALLDAGGQQIALGGTLPLEAPGLSVPVEVRGQSLATVRVAATQDLTQHAARDRLLILVATAIVAGLLASLLLRLMLLEGSDLPMARLLASLRSIGRGRFDDFSTHERRGPVLQLARATTRVIAPIRQGHRQLLAAVREISAVDLDHAARARLDPALELLNDTYRFGASGRGRRVRAWTGWWLVAALLLGEAVRPLVGGFAADRAPGVTAEPGRIALVFLAQALAAALGLLLAWRLRGGALLSGLALALCGLATLSVEWQYSGGLFLISRAFAAMALALGAGTLALSAGVRLRRPWLGLATLAAIVCCGPPLGSLLGELLGRRLAYAVLGGALLLLGIGLAFAARGAGRVPWRPPHRALRPALALGLAALTVNGWLFGLLAAFPLRYDYSLMALLLALTGAAALLAALPRPGLPLPLALLLTLGGPLASLVDGSLPLLAAGAAISGLGLGLLWRGARIATPTAALALLAGQGLGPAIAAVERWFALPGGALLLGCGLVGAAALILMRRGD